MAKRKAKHDLREPLILPLDVDRTWNQEFQLKQMKKLGASDLAIEVMKHEIERNVEHVEKARRRQESNFRHLPAHYRAVGRK